MKEVNWPNGVVNTNPWWKDGMTPEEFEVERTYFFEHWDDYTHGKYVPLWKQHLDKAKGKQGTVSV